MGKYHFYGDFYLKNGESIGMKYRKLNKVNTNIIEYIQTY